MTATIFAQHRLDCLLSSRGEGGCTPYISYIGLCGLKGYDIYKFYITCIFIDITVQINVVVVVVPGVQILVGSTQRQ